MSNKYSLASLLLAVLVCGCGKEAGRLAFAGEGTATATMPLQAGDVAFWTDIDLKYEGAGALSYRIELEQAGSNVGSAECNPLGHLNMKVGWVETHIGASRSLSGDGKMACSLTLPKAGVTNVRATLGFATRPTSVAFKKADLVLKQ